MYEIRFKGVVKCYGEGCNIFPHSSTGVLDEAVLKQMQASGYRFYLDGKQISIKELSENQKRKKSR